MTECDNVSRGVGNTRLPPANKVNAAKKWCFTFNNYKEMEYVSIIRVIEKSCRFAIIAKEIGESGTPHLQGYIEFKTRRRPKHFFGYNAIHWELAKGSRACNVEYCSKDDLKPYIYPKPYTVDLDFFYGWQLSIKTILAFAPKDRIIHWFWEPNGCKGKTTFAKWIHLNYPNVLALSGKGSDMKYGIVKYLETNSVLPKTIIIDIPRSKSEFVSYTGIEEVKDMFFFSGKYEGGMINGASPHVICFSNCPPDYDKMSADRWDIHEIEKPVDDIACDNNYGC